jgi:prepilin-type processing-associated H-X9-DG protein
MEGKPVPSRFALNLIAGKWSDDVRIVFSGDKAQEYVVTAAPKSNSDQVPLTEAHRTGVLDPMTALLIPVPESGKTIVSQACDRNIAMFDGHARYNLRLSFKRFEEVKTTGGYQGAAVVCGVSFIPIAGHDPKRYLVTYLAAHHDIEVWLVPLPGGRFLVPFRAAMPPPVGQGVLEATSFLVRPLKQ